jgi:hypothetical protein
MKKTRWQKGDTIIEVLISITVLSLILTMSYALANRSTLGNRQSQERGEGFKHSASQMERLKAYASQTSTPNLPAAGSKFCMRNDGTPTVAITGAIPTDPQQEDFSAFNDPSLVDCKKDAYYYSYIERGTGAQANTFTAHTRWAKVGGDGVDESTMVHKLYPDLASVISGGTTTIGCPVNHFMNSLGGCTVCPSGYSSPGGTSTSCIPVPPKIIVVAKKIRPNPGDTTPPCSSNNLENRSNIPITLSRGAYSSTQYTDSNSEAHFDNLALTTPYNATVGVPAPTDKYEVCPPSGHAVTSGGLGASVGVGTVRRDPVEFKVRPLCWQETRYTAPYYHNIWDHDHGSNHEHGEWVAYWAHTGPDNYYGRWPFFLPNPHYQWENSHVGAGWVYVQYSWPGPPANGDWRNRYEQHYYWRHDGWHWHSDWHRHYEDYRGDPYTVNLCPS